MTDNETNLTLLNVNQIVSLLSRAYIKLIKNGTPLKSFPSVMLWGPPGIGKSQGVREIAGNIQAKTGKMVFITDVRLLLFNPVDLRGIPTANADKTLSVWLKPQIFQMDESEDVINILFLDEITAAPQSVQAAPIRSRWTASLASISCRRTVSSLPPATALPTNPSPIICHAH